MRDEERSQVTLDVTLSCVGDGLGVSIRRGDRIKLATVEPVSLVALVDFADHVRAAALAGRQVDRALARRLQDAIFHGRLPELLEAAFDAPALLRLDLRDAVLHGIPWEALCDDELSFLGISQDLVLVRTFDATVQHAASVLAVDDMLAPVAAALASEGVDVALAYLFPTGEQLHASDDPHRRLFALDGPQVPLDARRRVFGALGGSAATFALVFYVRAGAAPRTRAHEDRHPSAVLSSFNELPTRFVPQRIGPGAETPSSRAARGELYPSVRPAVDDVEPDQVVTFVVRLDPTGPRGLSPLALDFPESAETVTVLATVSSSSFARPEGEQWEQRFVVDRRLVTTPAAWELRAKAFGDRPSYELTVSFDVADAPAGAYEVRLRRKGAPNLPGGRPAGGLVLIPRDASGARLVLKVSAEGPHYRLRLLQSGADMLDAPVLWSTTTDAFFTKLEAARSLADIKALGWALHVALPGEVTSILEDPALDGLPLLIASGAPVAPFELLRLRPRQNGPLLGVDRPVLRWTDDPPMPDLEVVSVTRAACIRPDYPPPDQLPSAAQEENDLAALFPALPLAHVALLAELDALLQDPSVQWIHFAGHADGNPARLSLQDAKVEPSYFDPGTPLMNTGPFLFLNGCRAAAGRTQVPEFQANMLKMLLAANCAGAVAPLTKVESAGARTAARTFYAAVGEGRSVGEAVRQVRELALARDADPKNVASYLSYLAFAPPRLCVLFHGGLL
jgi:hypothetical protein